MEEVDAATVGRNVTQFSHKLRTGSFVFCLFTFISVYV